MRKTILVLLMLAFTVEAMAALNVSCTQSGQKTVVVTYTGGAGDPNRPRAFAFDVSLSGGATISNAASTKSVDFYIYPGSIVIDANTGTVTNWGTPVAAGGNGSSTMTIEMGSLYATNDTGGHKGSPPGNGTLFTFDVSASTTVTIGKNASRGGVVKENGGSDLSDPVCTCAITVVTDCLYEGRVFNSGLTVTAAMVSKWVYLGKPNCWCCEAQKYGNGAYGGGSASYVDSQDLSAIRLAFGKSYTQSGYKPCSDLNFSGYVDSQDLAKLRLNFGHQEGTCAP
jgi:hypothetical protein